MDKTTKKKLIYKRHKYGLFDEFIVAIVRWNFYRSGISYFKFADDDYHYWYPFGMQTLKLAGLALWPFGKEVRSGQRSGGCLYILMNILWIFLGGIWICLSHLVFGAILCITIIGIPFGLQHFKLAALALSPFGKDIVTV